MAKNVIISDAFQNIQYIDSLELSQQINDPLNITPTFPTSFTNSVGVYCPAYTGTSGSYEFTFPITTTYKTFRLNNNYVVSNDEYPADNYIQTIMIPINLPVGCGDFQVTPYFHNSTVPAYIKQNSTFGIISSDTTVESNTIQFACESSNKSLTGQLEEGPSGSDALAGACGYFDSATDNPVYEVSGSSLTSTTSPSFSSGLTTLSTGIYILYYSIFTHIDGTNPSVCPSWSITCTGDPGTGDGETEESGITEFTVSTSNTNKWASVTTSAVGGSTKYGIYVTKAANPIYTFQNSDFYPTTTSGSVAIVELYANSDGYDTGDPNITTNFTIYDGVALTNSSSPNMGALSSNDAIYGINANTKQMNYVYNFTNNGYADTKKMAIGGNKNRRVFAIRSWGSLNVNYNKPSIAFIGNKDTLYYDGTSKGYSVGCAGATRTTKANTWVSHTAGDGTKYYSITNTATNVNASASITLTEGHTYRFTLHVNSEYKNDGVAICKTTNNTSFSALNEDQLLSATGKCSGHNTISTFEYTELNTGEVGEARRYIYFKSNSSIIGSSTKDTKSFADVMVEDLGDLREEQPAPLASNVTKEYGETATGGVSRLSSGYGDLQYRVVNSNGIIDPWSKTPPKRTEIGETQYQARYRGDATHKASPASTATLKITPKKITKPTAVTGLVYNGSNQNGVKNSVGMPYATTNQNEGGTYSAKNAGDYSITYTLHDTTIYCWSDGTTAPATVNWSIAPLEATLDWGILSWTYDGNSHLTTCTVSNLIGSDTCTVTLSGNSITDVGSTTVTAALLSNSNYTLPSDVSRTLTINPCMYFKKAGSWVPVKEVYKKVNGSWVKQTTTIGDVFSTSGKYLGRYRNGSTWVNLIEEKS